MMFPSLPLQMAAADAKARAQKASASGHNLQLMGISLLCRSKPEVWLILHDIWLTQLPEAAVKLLAENLWLEQSKSTFNTFKNVEVLQAKHLVQDTDVISVYSLRKVTGSSAIVVSTCVTKLCGALN
eukprot:319484-Rhodomonas_salina.1